MQHAIEAKLFMSLGLSRFIELFLIYMPSLDFFFFGILLVRSSTRNGSCALIFFPFGYLRIYRFNVWQSKRLVTDFWKIFNGAEAPRLVGYSP